MISVSAGVGDEGEKHSNPALLTAEYIFSHMYINPRLNICLPLITG